MLRLARVVALLLLAGCSLVESAANPTPAAQNTSGVPVAPGCATYSSNILKPESLDDDPTFLIIGVLATPPPQLRPLEAAIQFTLNFAGGVSIWDAASVYNTTAKPRFATSLKRRPAKERTNKNINTAMIIAIYRCLEALAPNAIPLLNDFLSNVVTSLPIADRANVNISDPVGIGNVAAAAVLEFLSDTNPQGTNERKYNAQKFSYPLNLRPNTTNDAFNIRDPLAWQPLLETDGKGFFIQQEHVGQQVTKAKAFSLTDEEIQEYKSPAPWPSDKEEALKALKAATDESLAVSANLTEQDKAVAEYIDDKYYSLAIVSPYLALARGWDLTTFLAAHLDTACIFDGTIVVWREKMRYAAIRPMSAVRYFYNNKNITAYARSVGRTVSDIRGADYLTYLRTMPHAEYPSGTSCIFAAAAEFYENFLGSKKLDFTDQMKAGCSRREPGMPTKDVKFDLPDTDALVEMSKRGRIVGGVHYVKAVEEGERLCRSVGKKCYQKVMSLMK